MPSYRIYTGQSENSGRTYTREELEGMTTLQLRDICYKQKINVGAAINTLDRSGLIDIILRYLGVKASLLIKKFEEGGFGRVEEALKCYRDQKPLENRNIEIQAKITLYAEIGIKKEDMYRVTVDKNIQESNVLLVNDSDQLCGIFNLVKEPTGENSYYLVSGEDLRIERSGNRNYSFLFFRKAESEYIYKAYYSDKSIQRTCLQYYKVPVPDLEVRELEETGTVLAIDFGTSNTTAGAYLSRNYVSDPCNNDILNGKIKLNEINYVKFLDVTEKNERWIGILPTIAYVEDCSDLHNIKYLFGYEAKNKIKKSDYTCNASVLQGIKRWVNNYSAVEKIFDEHRNEAKVKRSDILRAYLKHVIEKAEHQFKCRFKNLHISSPVKLKQQYIQMFQEILPEYRIEAEGALDEGIAVLYNTIANLVEERRFEDGEEYKALIIDCGGGTTDLTSCSFRIEEGDISFRVYVNTTYENGDTNFGGDNITYRIMQFMKIVFANYYKNRRGTIDIDSLIEIPSSDIFRHVDEKGVGTVYEKFERYYEEAEERIPTRFKKYENRGEGEYLKVKNNFHFLWEMADNMKKEFFRRTNILRSKFDSSEMEQQESDLHVSKLNKWCLYVSDNGELRDIYDFPNVMFNIKEINKLIKADIYEVVRKFLDSFYRSGKLQDYSTIKLTGQSCRIDIFKEALKEFVPGRSIEFKQKKEEDDNISDLKLSCLKGVLRYINSKKIGEIEFTIENSLPVVPYSVTAFTFDRKEKVLLGTPRKGEERELYISRPFEVSEVEFYLRGQEGNPRQKYIYINDSGTYGPVFAEDIEEDYGGTISQKDVDTIRDNEVRFFLLSDEGSWGFHVIPIARRERQLYKGRRKYFPYEDDLSQVDFFDGLK